MESETVAELFNHLCFVHPFHVDPRDRGLFAKRNAFLHGFDPALLMIRLIVVDQRNDRFSGLFLSDMNERSRRKTGFDGSFLNQFCHRKITVPSLRSLPSLLPQMSEDDLGRF